jgi:hypothetical protein
MGWVDGRVSDIQNLVAEAEEHTPFFFAKF